MRLNFLSVIGEAVTQMDQVTQQNAALVEQMAAAASSLKSQAGDLVDVVGVFKLASHTPQPSYKPQRSALAPVAAPHRASVAPAPRPVAKAAVAKPLASAGKPQAPAPARPAAAKLPAPSARKPVPAKPARPAGGDDDWETF